jgi:predicted DCC family thiol-disulfide oxidoreductase YuxK
VIFPRWSRRLLTAFLATPASPVNLALFRVVLFWTLLHSYSLSTLVWFTRLPADLRVPPYGLEWVLPYLPMTRTAVIVTSQLLGVFSFTAMIGLFTRTSALLAMVLALYVLGVPNFYGKVNHSSHQLIWFAAILAASRCGDALSCDAAIAAWRRAGRGVIDPPAPSTLYALPLRLVWLLMGLIYFFPGFWKLWNVGIDWALTDNLKLYLYRRWVLLDGWTPSFRIDRYPALYQLGGLGTMLFEVSFLFLILFPRLRLAAAFGGLAFHNILDRLMRIPFRPLQRCYVAFFDWDAILRFLGRRMFGDEMTLIYDGNCRFCCRTLGVLRVFDILNRVRYVTHQDTARDEPLGVKASEGVVQAPDVHAVVSGRIRRGATAYRALASRLPLLWPFWPFLSLWPISAIAERLHRHKADARTHNLLSGSRENPAATSHGAAVGSRSVIAVGSLFLLGNVFFGMFEIGNSWPLACYPTFSTHIGPMITTLKITAVTSTGEEVPVNERSLKRRLGGARYQVLTRQIQQTEDPERRRRRLIALLRPLARGDVTLQRATSVRFYKTTLITIPERWIDNPVGQELLLHVDLSSVRPTAKRTGRW